MTTALLDNATITAVQRIIGSAPSRSRGAVDVDLGAYENFIQARLFYDDAAIIDDYLPQHREARRAEFPYLSYIDPESLHLKEIAEQADTATNEIHPKIHGGEFSNPEFRALFQLLQTHMVCTWDMASSIYHLTLKVLAAPGSDEFDKYGAVATAIFQELGDARNTGQHVSNKVQLVDRFGKPIGKDYTVPEARWGDGKTGEPSGAIGAFAASLIWVANRAMFYSLAAAHLRADSFLYPIRQAYQQHYLAQTFKYDADFSKRLVTKLSTTLSRDVLEVHNGGALSAAAMDLPVFSAWLANMCGDPKAALHALEEIRMNRDFVDAREQLSELRSNYEDGSLAGGNRKLAKLRGQIDKVSASMREKYSVKTAQGVPVTRLVTMYNAYAAMHGLPALPKIDLKLPVPAFLRDLKRQVGFAAVYRNVLNDLATFGALGEVRDVLGRRVEIDKKAFAYSPKAEDPKYRRAHSYWKSPM